MSEMQMVAVLLFSGAYVYLSANCLRDGRLPNRVIYPLAIIAVVLRPDGVGLLPLDHLLAAGFVLLASVLGFRGGIITAGIGKSASLVALASGPLGVLALLATWLVIAGFSIVVLASRFLSHRQYVRFGAFVPLAGIHSVLSTFLPLPSVLAVDALTYSVILVGVTRQARRGAKQGLRASAAVATGTAPVGDVAGRETASSSHRIGELMILPPGSKLFSAPTGDGVSQPADLNGPAVVLATRGSWVQLRDHLGVVGWLELV